MQYQYKLSGMSCDGCRTTIENAINQLPEVQANVTLDPPLLTIESEKAIPAGQLQEVLSKLGNYQIVELKNPAQAEHEIEEPTLTASSKFHCPIGCEGEKYMINPDAVPSVACI